MESPFLIGTQNFGGKRLFVTRASSEMYKNSVFTGTLRAIHDSLAPISKDGGRLLLLRPSLLALIVGATLPEPLRVSFLHLISTSCAFSFQRAREKFRKCNNPKMAFFPKRQFHHGLNIKFLSPWEFFIKKA